jgi:hypothetical protein
MKKLLSLLLILIGLGLVANALRPARNPGEFDVVGFGRLPVLANGRIKPIDTIARSALLQFQGKQAVVTPEGGKPTPVEWLLDVCFRRIGGPLPSLRDRQPRRTRALRTAGIGRPRQASASPSRN